MKRISKIITLFILVIILILVSFDSVQTKSHPMKIIVNTPDTIRNDSGELDISNQITAENGSDYLISGDTAEVHNPRTVCSSNNHIFIMWREGEKNLLISEFSSNLSLVKGSQIVLDTDSLALNNEYDLGLHQLLIDSVNNLHLFWCLIEFSTPQRINIFYQKLNTNLETIITPKIVHTFEQAGNSNYCPHDSIRGLLIDETDSIHLLIEDNFYYLMNNEGDIKASTEIPTELGQVQDLLLDSEGDALILCVDDDSESISSIKYTIGATSIIEQSRNLLFDTTDVLIHYARLHKVENTFYFCWRVHNDTTQFYYHESFLLNSDGSLGDSGTLNDHFFTDTTVCLNSTHTASLSASIAIYDPVEIYYSLFSPTQNQSHIETKLLIRFLKNEYCFWGPAIFDLKIILDMESEMIISWYVNDGQNGFQVFLWKIDYFGIKTASLVVVAPELQYHTINQTRIISMPRLPFLILSFTISIIIPILLNRKRKKISTHSCPEISFK